MKKINHLILIGIALVLMVNVSFGQTPSDSWLTKGNETGTPVQCTATKLGTLDNCSLRFFTNNTFRSVITETGQFGFGIAQPKSMFHIHQPNGFWSNVLVRGNSLQDSASNSRWSDDFLKFDQISFAMDKIYTFAEFRELNIQYASEASILLTNANIGSTANDGLKISIYNEDATFHLQESGSMLFMNNTTTSFQLDSDGDFYIKKGSNYPFYYKASTNRIGIGTSSPVALFLVNGDSYFDGNIGVGTTTTHGYKVAVKGKILCEEVVCKNSAYWPDYVYQPNYKIKTIKELSIFVKKFGHLPGMPSAAEIEETGLNLVEVSRATVEKVEESSLYIIELDEHIDVLQCEIETQKVQINIQEVQINAQKVQIEEQDRKIEEQNQKIENLERLVKEFMSNNKNSNNEK